jgi:peptidoglycan hydrolase-like protein with peptidoglycan-binding domain
LALSAVDEISKTASSTTGTIPASTTVMPAPSIVLNGTISIGAKSDDVKNLQSFLIGKGLLAPGNTTGYFGNLTAEAVKKYQTQNNLAVTGKVDNDTLVAINTNTIRYYDSVLGKNIKVSQAIIQSGSALAPNPTVTCAGSCTGNGCLVKGCEPNWGTECTSCDCTGDPKCSACTCTKTRTGVSGGSASY